MEGTTSRLPSHHPQPEAFLLRFFQPPADARFYAGVGPHARTLFVVVLDRDGRERFARNLTAAPEPFLRAVAPFRHGLVVGCECMRVGCGSSWALGPGVAPALNRDGRVADRWPSPPTP